MAEHTIITQTIGMIKDNKDIDFDLMVGEFELEQTKIWNELASTKLGQVAYNKMYVEDISNDVAINKHFKSGLK